jgi:hypothetical protein
VINHTYSIRYLLWFYITLKMHDRLATMRNEILPRAKIVLDTAEVRFKAGDISLIEIRAPDVKKRSSAKNTCCC